MGADRGDMPGLRAMSDDLIPERIWIKPCNPCDKPDAYYVCDPRYLDGRETSYIKSDIRCAGCSGGLYRRGNTMICRDCGKAEEWPDVMGRTDELSRLRAEVERLTAERDEADRIATLRGNHIEFTLLPQMMDLEFALADERQRAEELAEALNDADTILGTYIALFGDISGKQGESIKGLHAMRHST